MSDDEDDGPRRGRRERKSRRKRNDSDDDQPAKKMDGMQIATQPSPRVNGDSKSSAAAAPAVSSSSTSSGGKQGGGDSSVDAQTRAYEPIVAAIEVIKANTKALKKMDTSAHDDKSRAAVNKKLDGLVTETTKKGLEIKSGLEKMKQANIAAAKNPGKEIRENLYKKHAVDFQSAFTEYKTVTDDLKKRLVDDKKRQLKTVSESVQQPLSDAQIEVVIERGQADAVIQQVMMEDNTRLYDLVQDIEERHTEILKLETQVIQVFELFKDLATLVDIQQENIDSIDSHIVKAAKHVEKGEAELVKAAEYQRKARQRRCMILICLLVILCVMLASILGTVLKDS